MGVLFLKNKKIIQSFIWFLCIGLVLRCAQLLLLTAENTGFFLSEYKTVGMAITMVIILLVVLPFIFAVKGKRQPTQPPSNNRILSIAALCVALTVFIEVLTNDFPQFISIVLIYAYRATGIAAAVVMMCYGLLGFVKNFNFLRGWLSVAIVFAFFRLIVAFSCYSSLAGVADSYIDIFMLCAQLCFLLYFAKTVCDISIRKSSFAVLPTAIVAIYFTAINTLPKIIMYCIGKSSLVHPSPVYLITNLAIGAFAIAFAYSLFCKENMRTKVPSTIILPADNVEVSDDSFYMDK